jgi:hypothetical protein
MPRELWQAMRAAIFVAVAASACTGEKSTSPLPSIELTLSTNELTVPCGRSGSMTATLTRGGGFTGPVTIAVTGLPDDVVASVSPEALSGSVTTATVTIEATESALPGSYVITVTAVSSIGEVTTTYRLLLVQPPDFSINATPDALTIGNGGTGTTAIDVARVGGFAGAVALYLAYPPPGISATFSPATIDGNASTATIQIASSVAAGTYALTIWGMSSGYPTRSATVDVTVVEPEDFSLELNPPALSFERPGSGQTTVQITRTGGFTGAVALSLVNPPEGIEATFTPASPTGTSASMSVTAIATVPAQAYTLTVRGSATAIGDRDVPLTLTLLEPPPPGIALELDPADLVVEQWKSATSAVRITYRNYEGPVTLAATGAPAGVQVSLQPAVTSGSTSTVTAAVDLSVPTGVYPITVFGSGDGIATATATLHVTVIEAGGETVEYQFCDPARLPVFFAVQDGAGPWRAVQATPGGTGMTYRFPVASSFGAITYVTPVPAETQLARGSLARMGLLRAALMAERARGLNARPAGAAWTAAAVAPYQTSFAFGTAAELQRDGADWCEQTAPTGTYTGTVAGVAAGSNARIAIGGEFIGVTGAAGTVPYTIEGAFVGTKDLFASRRPGGGIVDRYVAIRDLLRPNGGTLPLIDFAGADAVAPVPATLNVSNTLGDFVSEHMGFRTSNGVTGNFVAPTGWSKVYSRPFGLLPPVLQRTGDVMGLEVRASIGLPDLEDDIRLVSLGLSPNQNVVNVTFGPRVAAPVITTAATAPYLRLRAQGTLPAEYPELVVLEFEPYNGGAYGGNYTAVALSRGYIAAAGSPGTYDVTLPDLSTQPGFPIESVLPRGELFIRSGVSAVTGGINQNPYQLLRIGLRVDWARTLRYQTF